MTKIPTDAHLPGTTPEDCGSSPPSRIDQLAAIAVALGVDPGCDPELLLTEIGALQGSRETLRVERDVAEAKVRALTVEADRLERQAEHARLVNAGPPRPAAEALERVSELTGLLAETRAKLRAARRTAADLEVIAGTLRKAKAAEYRRCKEACAYLNAINRATGAPGREGDDASLVERVRAIVAERDELRDGPTPTDGASDGNCDDGKGL